MANDLAISPVSSANPVAGLQGATDPSESQSQSGDLSQIKAIIQQLLQQILGGQSPQANQSGQNVGDQLGNGQQGSPCGGQDGGSQCGGQDGSTCSDAGHHGKHKKAHGQDGENGPTGLDGNDPTTQDPQETDGADTDPSQDIQADGQEGA